MAARHLAHPIIPSQRGLAAPAFFVKVKDIGEHFVLQVAGDALTGEGIQNGDRVIFKRTTVARDGQTVVAIINNNEAVITKYYRKKDRVELHPANSSYRPIIVEASEDLRIEGILAGVIRTHLIKPPAAKSARGFYGMSFNKIS